MQASDGRRLKALQVERLKTMWKLKQIEDKIKAINGKHSNNRFAILAANYEVDEDRADKIEAYLIEEDKEIAEDAQRHADAIVDEIDEAIAQEE